MLARTRAQSMILIQAGKRARNLARDPSCGSRIRSERGNGLGTELWADSESGVGIDPEAHADSVAKYDSEAGWEVRSESGSGSEMRKSNWIGIRVAEVRFGPSAELGSVRTRPQSIIPKRAKKHARNLARNPSCGSRIRSERGTGIGTEFWADSKSGVGIDPEAPWASAAT